MASHHTTSDNRESQPNNNGRPGDTLAGSLQAQFAARRVGRTGDAPLASPRPETDADGKPWSKEEHVTLGYAVDFLRIRMPHRSPRELVERLHLIYVANKMAETPGKEGKGKIDPKRGDTSVFISAGNSLPLLKNTGEQAFSQTPKFTENRFTENRFPNSSVTEEYKAHRRRHGIHMKQKPLNSVDGTGNLDSPGLSSEGRQTIHRRLDNPSKLGSSFPGFLESRKRKFSDAHPLRPPPSTSIPQGSQRGLFAGARLYAHARPTSGQKHESNVVDPSATRSLGNSQQFGLLGPPTLPVPEITLQAPAAPHKSKQFQTSSQASILSDTARAKMSIASMLDSDKNGASPPVTLPEDKSTALSNIQEPDRAPTPDSPSESVMAEWIARSFTPWSPLQQIVRSPILRCPIVRSPTVSSSFIPMSPPTPSHPHPTPPQSVTTPPP